MNKNPVMVKNSPIQSITLSGSTTIIVTGSARHESSKQEGQVVLTTSGAHTAFSVEELTRDNANETVEWKIRSGMSVAGNWFVVEVEQFSSRSGGGKTVVRVNGEELKRGGDKPPGPPTM